MWEKLQLDSSKWLSQKPIEVLPDGVDVSSDACDKDPP